MNIPFQAGSQKIVARAEKNYHPYLYRMGKRRYAGRGMKAFCTATLALEYSRRWAERAARFLEAKAKEAQYAD